MVQAHTDNIWGYLMLHWPGSGGTSMQFIEVVTNQWVASLTAVIIMRSNSAVSAISGTKISL